jgi:PUA domain protein
MFNTSNLQQTEHNHYAFAFYILNNTVYVSMFKKFDPSSDVSTSTQVKASVQRAIRSQIQQAHPALTNDILDELLPKKHPLVQYKVGPHLMLYCRHVEHDDDRSPTDEPMFFQHRDGPILPTLKLVHQYPSLELTSVTVDKGAIPFILGGASIMCPGLTKEGCSKMPPDGVEQDEQGFDKPGLEKGDGVVIYAEGKEHAIAVGTMTMSSAEIREKNNGIGIDVAHFIGDGLFQTDEIH